MGNNSSVLLQRSPQDQAVVDSRPDSILLALAPPHTTSFGPFLLRVRPNKSYAEIPPPAPTLSCDRLGLEKGVRLSPLGK